MPSGRSNLNRQFWVQPITTNVDGAHSVRMNWFSRHPDTARLCS
jgi:hypothetical protein